MKRSLLAGFGILLLAGCASSQPKVIQASADAPDIRLTTGLATQIEMPEQGRVMSIAVGNPALVSAEKDGDVVSLFPKGGEGQTNLIIRARDGADKIKVYQYRVFVQDK